MASRETSRDTSYEVLPIIPIGRDGLDLFTDAAALPPSALIRSENMRLSRGTADRRLGGLKLGKYASPGGALTFGTTGKYATIPAATQLLVPTGGWAFRLSGTAKRPSGGNTSYLVSSRPTGQTYHVLKVTLSDAGVLTVTWRDAGNTDRTVACTALDDEATFHLLAIYDAPAGTFTVYVNGASSGTPLTNLDATLQPIQTSGVVWAFGVEKETGNAVTANSQFLGKMDAATLFTLRGTRPSSGTTTLASVLRKHTFRSWPTPQMAEVLFHYDFDSTTTFYDGSNYKNHGTISGTPTLENAVAYDGAMGQTIHTIQSPSSQRTNVYGAGGGVYYEITKGAS